MFEGLVVQGGRTVARASSVEILVALQGTALNSLAWTSTCAIGETWIEDWLATNWTQTARAIPAGIALAFAAIAIVRTWHAVAVASSTSAARATAFAVHHARHTPLSIHAILRHELSNLDRIGCISSTHDAEWSIGQVETTRRTCLSVVVEREMAIAVRVTAGRSNVGGVHHISIDEKDLLYVRIVCLQSKFCKLTSCLILLKKSS